MNEQSRKILLSVFTRPFSANIQVDDLKHVLQVLGADIDDKPQDRIFARLNGHAASFRYGGQNLPPEEVVLLKKFLEACGVTPTDLSR